MVRRTAAFISAGVAATLLAASPAGAFTARGSVEQVYVTGLADGAGVSLADAAGRTVGETQAASLGGALFRDVKPGGGYRVRVGSEESGPITVLPVSPAPPSTDVYDQVIPSSGYGYLTTRDGTKLAISVRPPQDVTKALGIEVPAIPAGPTPTLIEYAGYGYADPKGPESGIALIANLMGFTVVNVNMRGTGCSGGAFDFFEPLQGLDGYDVIETIARQPWVLNNQVGMMGISYGGISQLFTARYNPPSLAAISPLSVIDATQTTLYPGGILNTGFALEWGKDRIRDALPAGPAGGQRWAHERILAGDEVCRENQVMHEQALDLMGKLRANSFYVPEVADPLAPATFVDEIEAPTFLVCQYTDEQTGGHCPTLASRFTSARKKWFTFTNGTHVDSLAPEILTRWFDFLHLYVAEQNPAAAAPLLRAAAPLIYSEAMGAQDVTLPPDPVQQQPTHRAARELFERQPPVRLLFDNGAGGAPGLPYAGFEHSFPSYPPPGATARTWYFGPGGTLRSSRPRAHRAEALRWGPGSRPSTSFTGNTSAGKDGLWTPTPPYRWRTPQDGTALSYVSEPLSEDTVVAGAGAVHAWLRATKRNVDLAATVSEVRPDGKETFVQGGWLRTSMRKLDAGKSTPLAPVLSLRRKDRRPVPSKRYTKVVVPLYYQGHAYRKGSRIRVTISSPHGDQPVWDFAEAQPHTGGATVSLAFSRKRPSRVVLPVVPGLRVPTPLPPCPSLRGQPCRDYEPITNRRARPAR